MEIEITGELERDDSNWYSAERETKLTAYSNGRSQITIHTTGTGSYQISEIKRLIGGLQYLINEAEAE